MELYVVHCDNEIDGVYSTFEKATKAVSAWYDPPCPDLEERGDGVWRVSGDNDDDHLIIVRVELDMSLMES